MADVRTVDVKQYVSTQPEGTYNTAVAGGANYVGVFGKQIAYLLPQAEQTTNEGQQGRGHDLATALCQYYWSHPAFGISDDIQAFDGFMGRLALRGLGGTPVITEPVASTVYKHTASPLAYASGHQLPGSTFIHEIGADSFQLPGCVVESFKMAQQGTATPTFEVQMVGTGKMTTPHGVASLPTSNPTFDCVDGNNAQFIWTDATPTTVDWSTLSRVMSWSFMYKNNHRLNDRRQGDPLTGPTNGQLRHVRQILRGRMTVEANVSIAMASADIAEWVLMAKNTTFTNVTFRVSGSILSGSTRGSIEAVIPTAKIKGDMTVTDQDGLAVVNFNIVPLYTSAIGGLVQMAVTNTTATNYK
jgi:hypothetical protein